VDDVVREIGRLRPPRGAQIVAQAAELQARHAEQADGEREQRHERLHQREAASASPEMHLVSGHPHRPQHVALVVVSEPATDMEPCWALSPEQPEYLTVNVTAVAGVAMPMPL